MRGKRRIREKRLKKGGWKILEDSRFNGKHRLVLEGPGGNQVVIEAPTRPRAYLKAEKELLGVK
ncbi:MAG: hypothetical protein KatS3mg078_1849 [Deltaproteobacteria bacterium]|jgi:hypothetical protein|nr:MAG: hypothetical protein KatS3mg078_1849 [Deltaproteobacteria bacterium]